jgi:hypothetical protein
MTKGFKEYLQNTKDEFVIAVYELNLSPAQRVLMENMIIAFDQCRHKLEAQLQQPVVGGPVSDVRSEGEQLGNEAGAKSVCDGFKDCIAGYPIRCKCKSECTYLMHTCA